MTRTEAIEQFLRENTHKDLSGLYSYSMECQVNVAQDSGERIESEYRGKKWHGWTDGITTWKSFRIPWQANTNPEYEDKPITFDLTKHVEGIGMTGWDWQNKLSRWVAFDFDSLVGHKSGLTNDQLSEVVDAAKDIDWVTIRTSASGRGIHIYVFLEPVETQNHNEHAALARSILGMMSGLAGIDFESRVDICGGNMWVWHRKMADSDSQGLKLVKKGTTLASIPPNWRDHLKVISRKERKARPDGFDPLADLCSQVSHVQLDDDHKKLIQYLKEQEALWWWDSDHHMLVTHTWWLQKAHRELQLRGIFQTNSAGRDLDTQNCFCHPIRKGGWTVRRYSQGCDEHPTWSQDASGWTKTFLNREPDLSTAARGAEGLEELSGAFYFKQAISAQRTAQNLGVTISIPDQLLEREAWLRQHKDGRLVMEIMSQQTDGQIDMSGWHLNKKKWTRIFQATLSNTRESEHFNYDDTLRALTAEGESIGWVMEIDGDWVEQPLVNVREALKSLGHNAKEISQILGGQVFKPWKIVNRPFQDEYPGDREWNRNAAKFRYIPKDPPDPTPTWNSILEHCGLGIDSGVRDSQWCKTNGIITGADYLRTWVANVFQRPTEPLPYLFFLGPQNSGKSIFHESLALLVTSGYQRADLALKSQAGFNGELEGAVLCVVEETNLGGKNRGTIDRIKDWVTSPHLNIRHMYRKPYHIPNTTHWIQCANDMDYCPIFPGDTRIVVSYVPELEKVIPKRDLLTRLESEAPSFLYSILNLELPAPSERLAVPVVSSSERSIIMNRNSDPPEVFFKEQCEYAPGLKTRYRDLYDAFVEWCDPTEAGNWTKIAFGRKLPSQYPKGRAEDDKATVYVGNLWLSSRDKPTGYDRHAAKYFMDGEQIKRRLLK